MKRTLGSIMLLIFISLTPFLSYSKDKIEAGIEEQLDQFIPDGIQLVNDQGELVDLKSLIDKPTVISFVYYRCPGICSPLMDGIAEVIRNSELELGKDFQVFTISFDYTEDTPLARDKRKNYLKQIKKEVNPEGWRFFTADSANVMKATQSMGFYFLKTGNEWTHPGSLIMLSPKGKVTRYLYGTYFIPFDLKMSVAEAIEGKAVPTRMKVLKFCYAYDPAGQTYALNITRLSGVFILGIALLIFITLAIRKKTKKSITN